MFGSSTKSTVAMQKLYSEIEWTLVQCSECSYEWRSTAVAIHGVLCPVCSSPVEVKEDLDLELV